MRVWSGGRDARGRVLFTWRLWDPPADSLLPASLRDFETFAVLFVRICHFVTGSCRYFAVSFSRIERIPTWKNVSLRTRYALNVKAR